MKFLLRLSSTCLYFLYHVVAEDTDVESNDEDGQDLIKSNDATPIFLRRNNTDEVRRYAGIVVLVDEKFWSSKWQLLFSFVAACMTVVSIFTAWIFSMFVLRGFGVIVFSLSRKIMTLRPNVSELSSQSYCSSWYDSKKNESLIHHLERDHGDSVYSQCPSRCSSSSSSWGSFHSFVLASDSSTDNSWTPKSATCSLSSSTITKMFRTESSNHDEI